MMSSDLEDLRKLRTLEEEEEEEKKKKKKKNLFVM